MYPRTLPRITDSCGQWRDKGEQTHPPKLPVHTRTTKLGYPPPVSDGIELERIVQELARVSSDPDQAVLLATRAGFPREHLPKLTTPLVFWNAVIQAAEDGRLAGGAHPVLAEAARQYPGNPIFQEALATWQGARAVAGPVAAPFAGSGDSSSPTISPPAPPAPSEPPSNDQLSVRFYAIGVIAFLAGLLIGIWGFAIGALTSDQREISSWLFSIASGFAAGSFAGGIAFERTQSLGKGYSIAATSGFAVWLIVFLLIFRPPDGPDHSHDLLITFQDAADSSAGIDGRFVIVLGSEEHGCVLAKQSSCRIPDIPGRFVGTTITARLDDSTHRVINGPYAVEEDGNVTISVEKIGQTVATPAEARLTAVFVRGEVIELLPRPDMLNVTPTLRLTSESSRPIAIGWYEISIVDERGRTLVDQEHIGDSTTRIEPGKTLDVTLDLLLPRSAVEGGRSGGALRIFVRHGPGSDPHLRLATVDVALVKLDWLSDGPDDPAPTCPVGSLPIYTNDKALTCVETAPRDPIDRKSASNICRSSGWDLCRSEALEKACEQEGDIGLGQTELELTFEGLWYEDCKGFGWSNPPKQARYRCCTSPASGPTPSPPPRSSVPENARCEEWTVHEGELVCKVCIATLSLGSHVQGAVGSARCSVPMKTGVVEASVQNAITGDGFYENDRGNTEMAGRYEYQFWLGKRNDDEKCEEPGCYHSCNAPGGGEQGCVADRIVKTPAGSSPKVRGRLEGKDATLSMKNVVCSPRKSPDRCFIYGDIVFTWVSSK